MTAAVIDLATRQPVTAPTPTDSEIRFAKASAQQRLRITKGREALLATLQPAITKPRLTTSETIAYFRVNKKVVHYIAHAHRAELQAVGHERGEGGRGHESTFSRRAILHMALIMREGTSERGDVIKRALGEWAGRLADAKYAASEHEKACREMMRHAKQLAEDTQDGDPAEVWATLESLGRYELQGVAVALAALLPLDQHGLYKYLSQVGLQYLRDNDLQMHPSRAAAAGLSVLIPEKGPRQ